jgi:hypothetical protein
MTLAKQHKGKSDWRKQEEVRLFGVPETCQAQKGSDNPAQSINNHHGVAVTFWAKTESLIVANPHTDHVKYSTHSHTHGRRQTQEIII